jgi:hypothetical protein
MWITVDGVRRWPVAQVTSLGNLRLAKACREVGLTPDRLGAVLVASDDLPEDDPMAATDRLVGMAVMVYASRVAAGEQVASVEAANDFPADARDIEDDDPQPDPEPEPDPTGGAEETGADPTS